MATLQKRVTSAGKATDLRHDFREAVQPAGIEEIRFHDLRHIATSLLADTGAQLLDIATILEHRQMQTTARYAHLTQQRAAKVAKRMAEKHLS